MERLQKVIASAGIASRRKAEELITSGKVKVNGKVVKELGTKVEASDEIIVNGIPIQKEEKVYFLFNKPKKVICSVTDPHNRETVNDYFKHIDKRIFPVCRLDYETTGLIIMTNDGEFAQQMMHPRTHIEKTYEVEVEGIFTENMALHLTKGIMIEGKKTLPAVVEIVSTSKRKNMSLLNITIFEGRNREIRKMMEYFNCDVKRLKRIQYGFLTLGKLRQGEYRKLRSFEVKKLMNLVK